ncbi:MAG: DnaJ domain-containing protein [Candidatus Solibacter usitatus]|nr:DnaJ domain-containing protein [Candidatus Solibacter usitatus]
MTDKEAKVVRLTYAGEAGESRTFPALLIEHSDHGMLVESHDALPPGAGVTVQGVPNLRSWRLRLGVKAMIMSCMRTDAGSYRLRLEYDREGEPAESPNAAALQDDEPVHDLYEVLQVNPRANADTIHRVYRMLAQRYHPDNRETGSEEVFKRITEAYNVLGDPARRAAYDIHHRDAQLSRWKIFGDGPESADAESEPKKRRAILQALYTRRLRDAAHPAMSIFEFEELLGVPREHLEFSLWFLKEKGHIRRSDSNRFEITVSGAESAEVLAAAQPAPHLTVASDHLLH